MQADTFGVDVVRAALDLQSCTTGKTSRASLDTLRSWCGFQIHNTKMLQRNITKPLTAHLESQMLTTSQSTLWRRSVFVMQLNVSPARNGGPYLLPPSPQQYRQSSSVKWPTRCNTAVGLDYFRKIMFHAMTRSISSITYAENLKTFAVGVALWGQRQESTTRQEPSTRSWILCARNAPPSQEEADGRQQERIK